MSRAKYWMLLVIIGSIALNCGCGQETECEGGVIPVNDNSGYEEEIDRLVAENQRLIREINRFDEEMLSKSDEIRQLEREVEISKQNHLLYADLMKSEGWNLMETEPLDPVWTELLCAYNRGIPDFEHIQELEDKELVEASMWLLYNLDFDFVEGDKYDLREMDGIPAEYVGVLFKNVFHRTIDLGPYSENGIMKPKAVSYHAYFHPRIITLHQRGDMYHVVLDIYVMAEDSGMEKEEFVEMVESDQAKKGYSSSMILKDIDTNEGSFLQLVSKRTVRTESNTLLAE